MATKNIPPELKIPKRVGKQQLLCISTSKEDCGTNRCKVWKYLEGTCFELNPFQTKEYNNHWELKKEIEDIWE
jgi:hypothetical protein